MQVSCIGLDWEDIPDFLGAKYGELARRLDLSFNQLRIPTAYNVSDSIYLSRGQSHLCIKRNLIHALCALHCQPCHRDIRDRQALKDSEWASFCHVKIVVLRQLSVLKMWILPFN
ncbi:hypothetical protein PO909_019142 [Leuciscus waleckii]